MWELHVWVTRIVSWSGRSLLSVSTDSSHGIRKIILASTTTSSLQRHQREKDYLSSPLKLAGEQPWCCTSKFSRDIKGISLKWIFWFNEASFPLVFQYSFPHPFSVTENWVTFYLLFFITWFALYLYRRCSTGEGIFRFTTTQGEDIIREIKKAVSNLASKKCTAFSPSKRTTCDHESCSRLRMPSDNKNQSHSAGSMLYSTPKEVSERSTRESSLKCLDNTCGTSSSSSDRKEQVQSNNNDNDQQPTKMSYDEDDYINDQLIDESLETEKPWSYCFWHLCQHSSLLPLNSCLYTVVIMPVWNHYYYY